MFVSINLANNQLKDLPKEFSQLKILKTLILAGNPMDQETIKKLKRINASNTDLFLILSADSFGFTSPFLSGYSLFYSRLSPCIMMVPSFSEPPIPAWFLFFLKLFLNLPRFLPILPRWLRVSVSAFLFKLADQRFFLLKFFFRHLKILLFMLRE